MKDKDKLIALYAQNTKHSSYQILSHKLSEIIDDENIVVKTRYEEERLKYILKNIDVKEKKITDIGGNSGFFSFEFLEAGASHVSYYEGNKNHADFVQLGAKILNVDTQLNIYNEYFSFDDKMQNENSDIVLLLNVLHHIGDDYGDSTVSLEKAKETIIEQLNSLTKKASICVFQLGFNWKGNRNIGLFQSGTKKELIDFIEDGVKNFWSIEKIGIAQKNMYDYIQYEDLNKKNIQRDDSLGEFLNRPLFILKSKYEKHNCKY